MLEDPVAAMAVGGAAVEAIKHAVTTSESSAAAAEAFEVVSDPAAAAEAFSEAVASAGEAMSAALSGAEAASTAEAVSEVAATAGEAASAALGGAEITSTAAAASIAAEAASTAGAGATAVVELDAAAAAVAAATAATAAIEIDAIASSVAAAATATTAASASTSVAVDVTVAATAKAAVSTGAAAFFKKVISLSLAKEMWSTYSGSLLLYPLATKSATGSLLYGLSDGITQGAIEDRASEDIDNGRIKRFAIWGIIDAFMTTQWYKILDGWTNALFPEPGPAAVAELAESARLAATQLAPDVLDAQLAAVSAAEGGGIDWLKVAFEVTADQVVYCPVWFLAFFTFGGIYERRPFADTLEYMKKEMVPGVTTSWLVWVPVMTVSFGFVSPELRVPFYLGMSFGYAILISTMFGEVPGVENAPEKGHDDTGAALKVLQTPKFLHPTSYIPNSESSTTLYPKPRSSTPQILDPRS